MRVLLPMFIVPLWLLTVIARGKFHAEPFELSWCIWVLAQGYCAALFGYLLAKVIDKKWF